MNSISDITQPELAQALQRALDNKTKPLGSLGRIETLAQRMGLILGTTAPVLHSPQLLVCAGDHGLADFIDTHFEPGVLDQLIAPRP